MRTDNKNQPHKMKKTSQQSYGNSSFWLDWDSDEVVSELDTIDKKSYNLYKLASAKRAISNFVNIVTNENIPVQYSTSGHSYTNGKTITIGSKVEDPSDFDISVGLALHEGSHILLSDFKLLEDLYMYVPKQTTDRAISLGVPPLETIKGILNWIEDRRIDNFIYSSSPGYRDYYRAMYDNYFNSPIIDKALRSTEYRDITIDSYMFRLINIINKNTDFDALPDLRKIYRILDLKNISRLKTSTDVLYVALDVFDVILNNLSVSPTQQSKSESDTTDSNSSESSGGNSQNENGDGDDDSSTDMSSLSNSLMGDDFDSQPSSGGMDTQSDSDSGELSKPKLSDLKETDKKKLLKQIEKQKDFLNGDIRKKNLTKFEVKTLSVIEESGSSMVSVGSDYVSDNQWFPKKGAINAIVVKNMTRNLMESDVFPLTRKRYDGEMYVGLEGEVQRGIQIGTVLGKKLQIRSESKTTIFNRQKVGKIDKRMLSSLGFGNENVFQYLETDSYKRANLHISLDASGSMSGSKWRSAITNIVALCKAVDMIPNLEIQVSIRTTSHYTQGNSVLPYIVISYDSTVDKFTKVKQLFPYLDTNGTTPEGLAFEGMLDLIKPSTQDMDSYFLNISDGMPYFSTNQIDYSGTAAAKHTSKIVKEIEKKGVKILSYYVDDYTVTEVSPLFKLMYGKGAVAIDVTNIPQITRTMNDLFLQK